MPHIFSTHGHSDVDHKAIAKDGRCTLGYRIIEAATDFIAFEAFDSFKAPSIVVGGVTLLFDEFKLKHVECETYDVDVTYLHPDKQDNKDEAESDQPQVSFTTTGASTHITHSMSTIRAYPPTIDKDMYSQAIGVSMSSKGQLKIAGCDVPIKSLKMTLSKKIAPPADPYAFARLLCKHTGKVSMEAWNGFQPNELLFLGAKLTGKKREKWSLDYEFDVDIEITEEDMFKIGELGPIKKEGHAHLWVEWKEVVVAAMSGGDKKAPQAVACFVERVHYTFSMAAIGL